MVVILCDFIEFELFGYEKGVFIGVIVCNMGCFEQVEGGMFFFDEIGDMLMEVQICFLCVFQQGEYIIVGGCVLIKINVCIVVVMNKDLCVLI